MFFVKKLVCCALFAFVAPAFAADVIMVLPQKMEGKWGQPQKKAEMELIEMKSTTSARLNAIFWDGCTRRGETTAELKDGTWTFIVPGGTRCEDIKATMTQVLEKNRFEGAYESRFKGEISKGNFYLEWK